MRIVIDCANGAGYKSAPKLLSDLGAKVFAIGTSPNGLNINDKIIKEGISKVRNKMKVKIVNQ